ncbi:hypothetical protein BGCPKDLD_5183 [Methylorubrum suomiense]|uniref:Uncharacterized protein n=1 Tax=Methylorubrum suomiense TaxID=144191 RepID=A0ABQ4V1U7_9HYPH|nr:hypothetical protein BGCPKDLD_5183 [Methylorubrum suomiense]
MQAASMTVFPPYADDPRRQVEKNIVRGEVRITEQCILILLLRAQGRDTTETEDVLDALQAEMIELRAQLAAITEAESRPHPRAPATR